MNMNQYTNTSTVTVKGQVVIPFLFRKRYGMKKGTKVCLIDRGEEIVIRPLTKDYFERMAGVLRSGSPRLTRALLKERQKERKREDQR